MPVSFTPHQKHVPAVVIPNKKRLFIVSLGISWLVLISLAAILNSVYPDSAPTHSTRTTYPSRNIAMRKNVGYYIELFAPGILDAQGAQKRNVQLCMGNPDADNQGVWDYQCADGWMRIWFENELVSQIYRVDSPR